MTKHAMLVQKFVRKLLDRVHRDPAAGTGFLVHDHQPHRLPDESASVPEFLHQSGFALRGYGGQKQIRRIVDQAHVAGGRIISTRQQQTEKSRSDDKRLGFQTTGGGIAPG